MKCLDALLLEVSQGFPAQRHEDRSNLLPCLLLGPLACNRITLLLPRAHSEKLIHGERITGQQLLGRAFIKR